MKLDPQPSPRRVGLRACGLSDVGRRRSTNEDAWSISATDDGGQLLIVADGMGGMGRGDEASRCAVDALVVELAGERGDVHEGLAAALDNADRVVRKSLCTASQQPGCTMAVVRVDQGRAHVAWVGDSLIWLVREGRIIARSAPHRLVDELAAAGLLRPRSEHRMVLGAVLSRCLGGRTIEEGAVRPSYLETPALAPGDTLLLCSDGLSDMVDEATILELLTGDPQQDSQALVDAANAGGGDDNITVIVAVVEPAGAGQLGDAWELGREPPAPTLADDPPQLPAEVQKVLAMLAGRI